MPETSEPLVPPEDALFRVAVVDPGTGGPSSISERLDAVLRERGPGRSTLIAGRPEDYGAIFAASQVGSMVCFPPSGRKRGTLDLPEAERLFKSAAKAAVGHVVLVSSAEIYGPRPHNTGFLAETRPRTYSGRNAVAREWIAFEELAEKILASVPLTILRPASVLSESGDGYLSRLLSGRSAVTLAGHDPSLQLLSQEDLVGAICAALIRSKGGIYNVSPEGVLPLRAALRLAKTRRLPVPRTLQRVGRWLLGWLADVDSVEQVDYVRYNWTVGNEKIRSELGFTPSQTSVEALLSFLRRTKPQAAPDSAIVSDLSFDDYGLDKQYVAAYGRTLIAFLRHVYWRIEHRGLEHIPKGRAVLAGVHRGFMPLDAVMTFHLIVAELSRYPRFLIHPTLIKMPCQFNFMTKLGGMIACQENADYVLERDEILGVYPEGIHGAFTYYRDAYKLGRFGRDEYVRMALRGRAPIVPFVTVGTPEIFPIFGKINWRWWKRFSLWPCFPIAPPFPLLPVPLPSKWHIQFLEPLHVEETYPPEAADDREVVEEITQEVKRRMRSAIDAMLARRRHIFFGSIFGSETS